MDSFYEYLLGHTCSPEIQHLEILKKPTPPWKRMRIAPWYVEAGMMTGQIISSRYDSLVSFWPSLQAVIGDIEAAATTQDAFFQVWKHYGFTPEGFDVPRVRQSLDRNHIPYVRSSSRVRTCYTRRPRRGRIFASRDFIASLRLLKTKCGYAHMGDVSTQELEDKMESFFLAETLKYLYLLFDAALDRENIVDGGPHRTCSRLRRTFPHQAGHSRKG